MKIKKTIFISILASAMASHLFSSEVSPNDSENMNLSDYYRAIDAAAMDKNAKSLVHLLNKLDACREVAFGNGYGPTNHVSLQIIVLEAINDIAGETISSTSIPVGGHGRNENWSIFLGTRKDDVDGILRMPKHHITARQRPSCAENDRRDLPLPAIPALFPRRCRKIRLQNGRTNDIVAHGL